MRRSPRSFDGSNKDVAHEHIPRPMGPNPPIHREVIGEENNILSDTRFLHPDQVTGGDRAERNPSSILSIHDPSAMSLIGYICHE